jgi:hypothetical protein
MHLNKKEKTMSWLEDKLGNPHKREEELRRQEKERKGNIKDMLLKYAVYTALLALLSVSLLAACSNSQATLPTSTPTTLTRSTSITTQTGSTCQTSQLKLAYERYDVSMTHVANEYSFQNTSNSTCTLFGYPDIHLLDSNHHAISTQVTHANGGYLYPAVPLKVVSLEPTAQVYFIIAFSDNCNVNSPHGTFLRATPSGQTNALTIATGYPLYTCDGVGVSPMSDTEIFNYRSPDWPQGG